MSLHELGYETQKGLSRHFAKTFLWMSVALALTALVAVGLYESGLYLNIYFSFGRYGSIILLVLQLFLVFAISSVMNRLSFSVVLILFFAYAGLTGINLSVLPAIYGFTNMGIAFACAALLFVNMGIIGLTTKKDLSSWGTILFAGLISLLIVTLINLFLNLETLDWMMNYFAIGLFMALTAYDMQKVRHLYSRGVSMHGNSASILNKISVYCALELYLDFINLFIRILKIIGRNKD